MALPKSTNISWDESVITYEDRITRNGHKGAILWFTGLSGSGKSTLSRLVEKELFLRRCNIYRLDGDNVRHGLNADLAFSPAGDQCVCYEHDADSLNHSKALTNCAAGGIVVGLRYVSRYFVRR